jgi:RES domain-containing protein
MTPLPAALRGGTELVLWRIDRAIHAASWDSGEGARLAGGRWNPPGRPALYCSVDPATTILEKAVNVGFAALDAVPHVMTSLAVADPALVHVLQPEDVPNPNWLQPGAPSAGQQVFGSALLDAHVFIALPSVVSRHSWNVIFDPSRATGRYALRGQEVFALDTRLHPARSAV